MNFHTAHLLRGGTMARAIEDDESLTILYGEGGGCTLTVTGGVEAVCLPLCGSLQVTTSSFACGIRTGEVLVTEHEARIKAVGYARAQWVALLGGRLAWRQLLGSMSEAALDAQLLPARHFADRDLRRNAVALVRTTLRPLLESAANAVVDGIVTLQVPLCQAISRCPGRTYGKRRQVFLRLQRVRNFMSICCDHDLDNDVLARMANYSPCHFLRTFNHVFRETPHAYLVNERLQRARRLLHSSDLAITEVALASGFENRSAFSRLFRQRFGRSASNMRGKARASTRAGN